MTNDDAAAIRNEMHEMKTDLKETLRRVEAQVSESVRQQAACRRDCEENRTPIYERLGKLEVAGGRIDERIKSLSARTGAIIGTVVGLAVSILGSVIQHFIK